MRADRLGTVFTTAALAIGLFVLPAAGLAADESRVLGLDECITMGFARDPGLRSDELEARIGEARLSEMKGQMFPSVALQGSYARLSDVAAGTLTIPHVGTVEFPAPLVNSTSVRVSVQQPLFTGQRISSSIRQAAALRDAGRGDVSRSRLELRYAITEAYWNLAKARAEEQTVRESVAQLDSHLADARKLLDQGMATHNDVLQAQMRLEDAKIELAGAENLHQISRVRLSQIIGLPWNAMIEVQEPPLEQAQAPAEKLDEVIDKALASRPEILAARSRISAQEASVDLASSGLFPSVYLTGDYTLADPNPRVFPQSDQFVGTWSVGIMASIDIGRYPQALAQAEQARDRLAQARENSHTIADAVTTDVIRAYLSLTESTQRLASLGSELQQAEENERVAAERFHQGVILSSERLDAQALLVRARLRQSQAFFDVLIDRAALEKAVSR
jgi:outer membrane protein TolC